MEQETISARMELNEYTNRVLAVLKAKYGLKDKSEALNKFAEEFGDEVVEKEASDEYVKEMTDRVNRHIKKYGYQKMSLEELDKLCGVN